MSKEFTIADGSQPRAPKLGEWYWCHLNDQVYKAMLGGGGLDKYLILKKITK